MLTIEWIDPVMIGGTWMPELVEIAGGRALVSVVDANGEVAEREVKVGVMNRVSAQILSGLEPGEKVVIGSKAPAAAVKAKASSSLAPNAPKGGGFK